MEWKWDRIRRAECLTVTPDARGISRISFEGREMLFLILNLTRILGMNPIGITLHPFTPHCPFIELGVDSVGDWIAIGATELQGLKFQHDRVLGTQRGGFNVAYFCQGSAFIYNGSPDCYQPVNVRASEAPFRLFPSIGF